MKNEPNKKEVVGRLQMTLLLFFMALASVVAVTVAWMSIADNGRIRSMNIDITAGISMKFDLDEHDSVSDYTETLSFDQIAERIKQDFGYDVKEIPLEPVTSRDAVSFRLEDNTVVPEKDGKYLTFTLHFMSMEDMVVHLTTKTEDGQEGTVIRSDNPDVPQAMRISFTADGETYIYDPGMGNGSSTSGNVKTFGLPSGSDMEYNDHNSMFRLTAEEDKEVFVHVWLEGNDPSCTDDIKGASYQISLRFQGTDEENNPLDEEDRYSETEGDNNTEKYTHREDTADDYEEKEPLSFGEKWRIFWERLLEDYE